MSQCLKTPAVLLVVDTEAGWTCAIMVGLLCAHVFSLLGHTSCTCLGHRTIAWVLSHLSHSTFSSSLWRCTLTHSGCMAFLVHLEYAKASYSSSSPCLEHLLTFVSYLAWLRGASLHFGFDLHCSDNLKRLRIFSCSLAIYLNIFCVYVIYLFKSLDIFL